MSQTIFEIFQLFLDLIEDSLAVGRSDECDIVIHKSKFPQNQLFFISKKHFILKRDPLDKNITYLTDLSKNGTFVNSHQVGRNKTIILQNNDFIAIGEKLIGISTVEFLFEENIRLNISLVI